MRAIDPVEKDLNEHLAAIDAGTARDVYLETLEDEIHADPELKTRLALLYAEDREASFFKWAAERLADEREPAHENGWNERPSNAEYWNWNDDRI